MARFENNLVIGNGTSMNSKHKLHFNVGKIAMLVYGVWVICSIVLATANPDKYATFFTDLPSQLKNIPPFVLSLTYLILFIPAVTSIILYAMWVLINIVRKSSEK